MLRNIQPCRYWGASFLFLCLLIGALTTVGQSKKDGVQPKVDSLKPVIVRPKEIRPKIHGDTTEYNTGNIQLRLNANVEELLRRLPGLQIDANGVITYNGEVISKLLVDGEDLFGSDPRIVTRNFDASRIAKVQLLDRKSDQARFTGIDDGGRTKTLNLILKEDSKKGYFGKVEAGSDANGLYDANGLIGSFRRREQIAALGFASNTGSTGFNSNNASIFGLPSVEDPMGASAGAGIPRFHALALHYANTWNGDNDHLVGNYQYGDLLTRPATATNTVQTLHDSVYGQYQRAQSVNRQIQHATYVNYIWTVNSLSAFQFYFNYLNSTGNNGYSDSVLSQFNDTTVNRTKRSVQSVNNRNNILGGVNWRIESRKKAGRIFSVNTRFSRIDKTTDGYLYSLNQFYMPDGGIQATDTVDQRKKISNQTWELSGGLNLAEPLWGKNVLGLSYNLSYGGNKILQSTYNRGNGKYQDFVDSLSSRFDDHTVNQSGSVSLQGNARRLQYALIGRMQWFSFQQKDLLADSVVRYHYFNVVPQLLINYTPNPTTHINLNYTGGVQQPGVTQLQPVKNNSDPLHITLGNPDLRPGFNQNLALAFTSSRTWMYNISLNLGQISNGISTKTIIDSLGRQVSQPVNVNGGRRLELNFSLNKKIAGVDLGMMTNFGYNRNENYINADLSRNDNYSGGGGFRLGKYVADKYSIQLNSMFTYFDSRSSINPNATVHYWTQSQNGNFSLFFIPGIEFSGYANYNWQQKSSAFAKNTSVLYLGASMGHNFLEGRLALRLTGNNLLNQNAGISRSNTANVNTETSTNILGRYFLLSLAYRFEHKHRTK